MSSSGKSLDTHIVNLILMPHPLTCFILVYFGHAFIRPPFGSSFSVQIVNDEMSGMIRLTSMQCQSGLNCISVNGFTIHAPVAIRFDERILYTKNITAQ